MEQHATEGEAARLALYQTLPGISNEAGEKKTEATRSRAQVSNWFMDNRVVFVWRILEEGMGSRLSSPQIES